MVTDLHFKDTPCSTDPVFPAGAGIPVLVQPWTSSKIDSGTGSCMRLRILLLLFLVVLGSAEHVNDKAAFMPVYGKIMKPWNSMA